MSEIQSSAVAAPAGTIPPEMMRALRERFRASTLRTCAAFRTLGMQLAATPDAPEVVDAVRRELHRVHGTAGSYGFREASKLALIRALQATQGNCHRAAELLGVSRYTVYRMLNRFGLGEGLTYRTFRKPTEV